MAAKKDPRPIKEFDFYLTFFRMPLPQWARPFIFPGITLEELDAVALLIPMSQIPNTAAKDDILDKLAYVTIPYHPDQDKDAHIYGFGVYIAWKTDYMPAVQEMLILTQYGEWMWNVYKKEHHSQNGDTGYV